ncbi:MAG: ice-binding family protein, partial [Bacteroidota bacterium]
MKTQLIKMLTTVILFLITTTNFAQAPPLGSAAGFVLFSTAGAVSNTGITHLTGNVGTNSGSSTGFGNVNGVMHDGDGTSAQCAADLLTAYNLLNSTVPTFFPAPLLGNGDTLIAGVYSITGATTLNLGLTLNAQGNPNAVFIFQIQGTLSTAANSKVHLINGAKACNVFWKVEGLVSMASGTSMKGTIIANNAAINMNTGDTLEGRALSTTGAVTVSGVLAYTPIGCGSPVLNGPLAPSLVSAACYTVFSSSGPVTNVGITHITGDVGTNSGLTTGFNPLFVTGAIHALPDGSTAACAADLLNAYTYINTLPNDIELLYPAQFGNQIVLTPHTYVMNGITTFTDTVFLDAQGVANAVFVIKVYGAFSTSVYSKVKMINGTQSKNVYWMISGAVTINDYSEFVGTIICNNGAMNLNTGAVLDGRALTTTGALSTSAITAVMPPGCAASVSPAITTQPVNKTVCNGDTAIFTVSATGTALTYQWRKGTVNLINGGNISGATSDTLKIYPVSISDTSSKYNVVIIGSTPPNDTSVFVSLMLNTFPVITTQAVNKTACVGSSAYLSVKVTGTNLTYQWRKGTVNMINGGGVSGATSDTLKFNPMLISDTSSKYNVIITGICSLKDTSINVSLMPGSVPVITVQPVTKTACAGSSIYLSVVATGTSLTYQWRKGTVNMINGSGISGVTSDTLKFNSINITNAANNYNVIIIGGCTPNDTSVNVSLVVNTPAIITNEPINQTGCIGSSVSYTVVASGSGLTYQWRRGTVDLINGGNISGATSYTLFINPISISDTAYNYNVIVSGTCSPNGTSLNVSLKVDSVINITSQPVNQAVCVGSSASFSVIATGSGLTYQWRKGNATIIGATSSTLTINPVSALDTAYNYNVIISSTCSPNDTSVNVSLVVDSALIIITQPLNQTVCVGSSVSFSVLASGAGLTYQWRRGTVNLNNEGNISGATSATLTINPVNVSDTSFNYNVVVTGACSAINSTLSTVDLKSAGEFGILAGVGISSTGFSEIHDMNVGISPGYRTSITGFPPAIVVNGAIYASDDIAPPGVPAMLIQAKQDLTDAYLFAEGATAPAPATVAGDQGGKTLAPGIYKSTSTLLIQSGDLTLDAQGDVNAAWIFQIASDFTTVGGAGGNVILSGGAQAKNVIWQVGSSATIGNYTSFKGNILALTSITMNTGSSIDGRLLARNGAVVLSGANIINNPSNMITGGSFITSTNVSLVVNTAPIIITEPINKTVCAGSPVNFSVVATGSNLTYQWRKGTVDIIGATSDTLKINSVTISDIASNYNVIVSGTCSPNDTSINVTLFVNSVYSTNNPQTICNGSSYILNGHTYTIAGNYNDTLTTINGCDSIILTHLIVNSVYSTNNTQTICNGSSYVFNGHTYTIAGNYNDTLTTINGCDSIIITHLI